MWNQSPKREIPTPEERARNGASKDPTCTPRFLQWSLHIFQSGLVWSCQERHLNKKQIQLAGAEWYQSREIVSPTKTACCLTYQKPRLCSYLYLWTPFPPFRNLLRPRPSHSATQPALGEVQVQWRFSWCVQEFSWPFMIPEVEWIAKCFSGWWLGHPSEKY